MYSPENRINIANRKSGCGYIVQKTLCLNIVMCCFIAKNKNTCVHYGSEAFNVSMARWENRLIPALFRAAAA
jgi:hypothetical protein